MMIKLLLDICKPFIIIIIIIIHFHYQKFAKYQQIYRRNILVGNLRSELPTETFSSVFPSVATDGNIPSVVTDWITDGKVSELKKRRVADVEVLAGHFFPTISPTDSKTTARTVTWPVRRLYYRRTHLGIWNGRSVRWRVYVSVRITDLISDWFTDGISVGESVGKS